MKDKKWFKEKGDAGFSPARNNAVIADSIKKYEAMRATKHKIFQENLAERTDAVATFLKAVDRGKASNSAKYFGKRELARLRGEQIVQTIEEKLAMIRGVN